MINDLLRDLVVEEKVVVFIDNVMITTKTEKEHDEIVEEVLRRLEENNLFVKPKKYVWKVSGMVHTRVKVCRMDSEMSGLVERPWLQLICCAICLPCGCNFR